MKAQDPSLTQTPRRLPIARHAPVDQVLASAVSGDRVALARLLSAVEAGGPRGQEVAGLAYRSEATARSVGITGAPGAGKSTLTGCLLRVVRASGIPKVAVLAVDPTSPFTGGAILGDRIRMQEAAADPGIYIRSMASRGHLGGLALAVPEAMVVLGAAGFPVVVVETVGVGQVEVEVATATDTTVVVVNPRWGDSVQANKAGLLEIADVFVINKTDQPGARETRRDLEQMLDLSNMTGTARGGAEEAWRPPVIETVASTGEGVEKLWEQIERHQDHLVRSGELEIRRRERLAGDLRRVAAAVIEQSVERRYGGRVFEGLVDDLLHHRTDPYSAAQMIVDHLGTAPSTTRTQPGAE